MAHFGDGLRLSCGPDHAEMMLEQATQTPQLPDGLAVRSGYDGPPSKHDPAHILGYGQPGTVGLFLQSFAFGCGHAYCSSGREPRFPAALFLHCLYAFQECEKRSAEHSRSPEARAFGWFVAGVRRLPTSKFEPLT